eukprot:1996737-Prymnesium_polylepis.1
MPQLLCCLCWLKRRLPVGSHHIAAHTRAAALICVEPSDHSPCAHCSQACHARGRARCSCASLLSPGATTVDTSRVPNMCWARAWVLFAWERVPGVC